MFKHEKKLRTAGQIVLIPQDKIYPNPDQPRKSYNYKELDSLAESIRLNGLLQPLNIRETGEGKYELVSGERRLRACKLAGIISVPCIIIDVNDEKSAIFSLIENIQRSDLSFFEEAAAIEALQRKYLITQEQLAKQLGRSQASLSNKVRLLRLSPRIRSRITAEGLSERHARAVLRLEGEELQHTALDEIVEKCLNCEQTDALVASLLKPEEKKTENKVKEPIRLFRDVNVFVNTLNHAVDTMRKAGIRADSEKSETEEYIEYVIRIPKTGADIIRALGRKRKGIG